LAPSENVLAFDVATVGDNCIDRYGAPLGMSFVGGNAVNVAVQLAARGLGVAYFGAVGDDAAGERTIAALKERDVIVDHVRILTGVTAWTDIAFDAAGERVFAFEEFGVSRGYRPSASEVGVLKRLRHVHLGWLDDAGALKRELLSAGVSVSQDLSVNAAAVDVGPDGLSIAFMSAPSREEADDLIHRALAAGATVAVATMGRFGSLASDGKSLVVADAKSVTPIDTTGAGDTFIAAFIAARLAGHDLKASLQAGRAASAETCLHYGGFPQQGEPV
jgi:fructoselysine 6-kinase